MRKKKFNLIVSTEPFRLKTEKLNSNDSQKQNENLVQLFEKLFIDKIQTAN